MKRLTTMFAVLALLFVFHVAPVPADEFMQTARAELPAEVFGTIGEVDTFGNRILIGPPNWAPPRAYNPDDWVWYDVTPGFWTQGGKTEQWWIDQIQPWEFKNVRCGDWPSPNGEPDGTLDSGQIEHQT
jgi:hypothetical protein